ncbi:hypothetical protein QEN19_003360 [Hanseniaspora menglaensis]
MLGSAYKKYSYQLQKSPKLTNFITTGVLFGLGDISAQTILPSKNKETGLKHFDFSRTLRAVFYGSVIFSPIGNKWYYFLQHKVRFPGTKQNATLDAVSRVLVDQLVFPPIAVPFYFGMMTVLESGLDLEKINHKIKASTFDTLVTNWCVWPFIQLLNFKYIRIEHRLLTVNLVSIFWNTFISYKNNINS